MGNRTIQLTLKPFYQSEVPYGTGAIFAHIDSKTQRIPEAVLGEGVGNVGGLEISPNVVQHVQNILDVRLEIL